MKMQWKMLIALVAGVAFGLLFGRWYGVWGIVINGIGQMFLRAMGMIVVPLVFLSTVLGISRMDGNKSMGKMTLKTFAFFLVTSILAAAIGILATDLIKPGRNVECMQIDSSSLIQKAEATEQASWMDKIVQIVPNNVLDVMSEGKMLPIILFSLLFGYFVTKVSVEKRNNINGLFDSLCDVIIKITDFVVSLAPVGVFAIIMNIVGNQAHDLQSLRCVLRNLLSFVCVFWITLLIMGMIVLPLMMQFVAKMRPMDHLSKIKKGLMLAFSTCSSYSAMPLLMNDTREKVGVSSSVVNLVIPLGLTFNKVGTILYECVAVIFVSQATGMQLETAQQLLLMGVSIVTVLGAPSIPMSGVIVLAVLLKAMGLPDDFVGMLMAVDIMCDMPKTLLNAYSMSCGAVIVAKREGETLCA